VCAVLSGCDGPIAIGAWEKAKPSGLKQHLELPHGVASQDTIGRLLMALKPAAFQACFANWVAAIIKAKEEQLEAAAQLSDSVLPAAGQAINAHAPTLPTSHFILHPSAFILLPRCA
jgi:hypothetical protein